MICEQLGCREQATVRHARQFYCRAHYRDVHLAHMNVVCQKKREAKIDQLERMLDEITPGGYDRSAFFGRVLVHRRANGTFTFDLR